MSGIESRMRVIFQRAIHDARRLRSELSADEYADLLDEQSDLLREEAEDARMEDDDEPCSQCGSRESDCVCDPNED